MPSAPGSPSANILGKESEKPAKDQFSLQDAMPHNENVTEQTHHIIIPSYASWFDYNRSAVILHNN